MAAGVESASQVTYLTEKGVQYAQGWYFAKAMPANELFAWLAKYSEAPQPSVRSDAVTSSRRSGAHLQ